MSPVMTPLPRYQCHKKVWALKIKKLLHLVDGSLEITPEESDFLPFIVKPEHVPTHAKARPQVGWYWVQYEGGYESFSPPKEFEEGYTLIKGNL